MGLLHPALGVTPRWAQNKLERHLKGSDRMVRRQTEPGAEHALPGQKQPGQAGQTVPQGVRLSDELFKGQRSYRRLIAAQPKKELIRRRENSAAALAW